MFGRLFGSKPEELPKPKDNLGMDDLPKAYGLYNIIKNTHLSKEEKQEQFKKEYEKLKQNKNPQDKIYFTDASHPHHNNRPFYGWIYKGEEKAIKTIIKQ
jgi:hypothetical protein